MTKICHVISGLHTGGAERALARLLTHGLEGRFENHVISLAPRGAQADAIEDSGAKVHCLDIDSMTGAASGLVRLRSLIHEIQPAILQGWMYHGNLAASSGALISGFRRPLVWNIRQSLDDLSGDKFLTRQIIRAGRMLSRQPDHIIYNSGVSARQHALFGYRDISETVIPNGFETGAVHRDAEAAERLRRRLGIPIDDTVFAHIARFHPMKDHATFLTAANSCTAALDGVQIVLAGRGVNPENTGLENIVPPHLRSRFHFLGETSEVLPLASAANCVIVSSSRAEGFPNVLGEAMMTSTACISTEVGDAVAILGDAGIIVPPSSPALLAEAMLMLARDPKRAAELGTAGRKRVVELFDIGPVVGRYIALYEKLLQKN